jgi:nickel-dependent lactate racemase
MHIVMKYGKGGLPLDLPDDLDITLIQKRAMPVLPDAGQAVRDAFSRPVGCRSLEDELKGCRTACILICDITRPVPNGLVLPLLIQTLITGGMDPSAISVIVATGLHRPNEGDELKDLVDNPWVLDTVRVANHFARSDEDHLYLGDTPSGMPVKLDRRFVEADLRIVVGLVEPHFMAGYSGGRKVIIPGIAHEDTIRILHSTRMLKDNKVANCVISGNPLHQEQICAARMAGPSFAVNTVIDEDRNLSFVNFGRLEESHLEAVEFARPYFEIPVGRRFKTVLTSAAGYPLDRNYYQTIKGMVGVSDILEPGCNLFIVSECREGLGTAEYADAQSRMIDMGVDKFFEESMRRETASIDEWESIMQVKAMRLGNIHLFSRELCEGDRRLTGVSLIESVPEAIEESAREKGDKSIAVIPEGPYVIPMFKPDALPGK